MSQATEAADDERQYRRDRYYMNIALQVRGRTAPGPDDEQPADHRGHGANCYGSKIGAVLVLGDRIIGTGYNGTPSGFTNCLDGGCVRCQDRWYEKQGHPEKMSDPAHRAGEALDRCICVHAEQNALLTAARFGIRVEGATLYTTLSPCFGCLKEALQAGITRIVYDEEYQANYSPSLQKQYDTLANQLKDFGSVEPMPEKAAEGPPDPYEDAK